MSDLLTAWCCVAASPIYREKGLVQIDSLGHMFLQLEDKEKFPRLAHDWTPVRPNFFIVETSRDENYIHFQYKGKKYDRKIRNGKFQFHNTEYTL